MNHRNSVLKTLDHLKHLLFGINQRSVSADVFKILETPEMCPRREFSSVSFLLALLILETTAENQDLSEEVGRNHEKFRLWDGPPKLVYSQ